MKILLDTNVLVSDVLWIGFSAMRNLYRRSAGGDGPVGTEGSVQLFTAEEAVVELRSVIRRVYSQRPREVLKRGVAARAHSLEVLPGTSGAGLPKRGFVVDPDDAFLDRACVQYGMDVLVTNDVRAFKQVSDDDRGYRLESADTVLRELFAELEGLNSSGTGASAVARDDKHKGPGTAGKDHSAAVRQDGSVADVFLAEWQHLYSSYCSMVGLKPETRPVHEQFRRARAGRFAKLLKGAQ